MCEFLSLLLLASGFQQHPNNHWSFLRTKHSIDVTELCEEALILKGIVFILVDHCIFPKIDVLVNNGGRSQRSLFVDTNLDVYNAIIELNYLGTISLTKYVLNHMIQRKKGKIVTVSSVMGIMGAPLATGYCASKHALQVSYSLGVKLIKWTSSSAVPEGFVLCRKHKSRLKVTAYVTSSGIESPLRLICSKMLNSSHRKFIFLSGIHVPV